MRLLDLPLWLDRWRIPFDVLPGWEVRGEPFDAPPIVVIGHHTGTRVTPQNVSQDLPTWRMLRDGRRSQDGSMELRGPLAQVGLGRTGRALLIAAGKANHAGPGRWAGLPGGPDYDVRLSARTVGIEAEHPGDETPWPQVQLDGYDRLIACLLWGLAGEAEAYCGHREWALPAGRKPDPHGIDLPGQRKRVAALLATGPDGPSSPGVLPDPAQEDDVELYRDGGDLVAFTMLGRRRLENAAELGYWRESGRLPAKVTDLADDPRLAAVVALLPWTEAAR